MVFERPAKCLEGSGCRKKRVGLLGKSDVTPGGFQGLMDASSVFLLGGILRAPPLFFSVLIFENYINS